MEDVWAWMRRVAVICYYWMHTNLPAAAKMLEALVAFVPGVTLPANPEHFINLWATRFNATNALHDIPCTGRPRKVPHAEALRLATILKEGVSDAGEIHHHYHSWKEAIDTEPDFAKAMKEYDCSAETLLQAMRDADPNLAWRPQENKWIFSHGELSLRVHVAARMDAINARDPLYKYTIVFLDEASLYLTSDGKQYVWCSKHGDRPLHLTRHTGSKYKKKMKFYIGVNAELGVFGPYFTTGTTGLEQEFTVSARNPVAASPCAYTSCCT